MRYTLLLLILFAIHYLSLAQVMIVPLEHNQKQAAIHQQQSGLKIAAVTIDTISIPFFEDFTTSNVTPDTKKWMPGGGVFVNNDYPIKPPNFNVATFDGIDASGKPYSYGLPLQVGGADSLTSLPIDLTLLKNGDSIYLRFYWQGDGLGELPDNNQDSIRLQLKQRTGPSSYSWQTVWMETRDSTNFNLQLIRIGDSAKYFYKGFQFRFQSFGRLSGSYDVWNIDYILLDTGRLAKDNWTPDFSYQSCSNSMLKNYTAMPVKQYKANKDAETADSIEFVVSSLYNQQFAYQTLDSASFLKNKNSSVVFQNFHYQDILNPFESRITKFKIDKNAIDVSTLPGILEYRSTVKTGTDPKIDSLYDYTSHTDRVKSDIDFSLNDSIVGYTNITNYYAYDDGTAEAGWGVNQKLGKVAVKFTLNVPDSLTHIRIYFPKIGKDYLNKSIILEVWSNIVPGNYTNTNDLLYSESVTLNYSNYLDGYYTYQLSTPVYFPNPNTTFYVGYQQSTNETILAGFDKNNDSRGNIFFNVNDVWQEFTSDSGSVMIRPVFGNDSPVLGVQQPTTFKKLEANVYPNPTQGELNIAGKIKRASIYDLTGKLVLTTELDNYTLTNNLLDLSFLPDGLYMLHLENDTAATMEKIFIRH